MPPEAVPSNASVASTGPGIRYAGEWVYAYSGATAVTAGEGETTKLEFTSGSGLIVAEFDAFNGDLSNDWWRVSVYLNDELVLRNDNNNNASSQTEPFNPTQLIIPPFTKFKATVTVGSDSDAPAVTLTGRVYE